MEPICLFPVSGIILRTCFRLFADSDVAFVFLADKLARFCHPIGKTLPPRWQNFAIGVAKVCQGSDNLLAKYLPDIQGVANNRQQGMTNIPDSAGSPMPDWHLSHPAK